LGLVGVIAAGAYLSAEAGTVLAFLSFFTLILNAMLGISKIFVTLSRGVASAERIERVLETDERMEVADYPEGDAGYKIEFKDVNFSYNGVENNLDGVSFKVQAGQTVGVIGGTGSGKSALVNLITRFYDAEQGEVLIDGENVKNYKLDDLRKKVGVVPQKAVLFSGTIADNLRWGNENASLDDMEKAVSIAQAKEFIDKLPEGFDTEIAQGGRNLSGGQKQRLTIARALTGSPEILILDDSASALDFATDAALRKAIAQNTTNMTVIIVSQRATSIRYADKIIVLDDGEAVGIGTHDKLMESCDVYREIVLSQEKSAKEGA
ncbi:MAG: ABC transporter ATP-binding protein/permease, partial [Oscillospiraceae bacterium]|nr:ABC transporter ATP-binding protein/permease [Oscillospiraceae bacterium]